MRLFLREPVNVSKFRERDFTMIIPKEKELPTTTNLQKMSNLRVLMSRGIINMGHEKQYGAMPKFVACAK